MSSKRSDCQLPEEVLGFLSTVYFMPLIAAITMFAAMLLPAITSLRAVVITRLFWIGWAAGIFGTVLLFFARLPLYRQRRFWAFGPRELDRFHRHLYRLAYLVLLVSVGLFVVVWLSLR